MKALLIFPDFRVEVAEFTDVYPEINRALGVEWIEGIYTDNSLVAYYLDEEGKLNDQPFNRLAEWIYRKRGGLLFEGDYLAGPVAITGLNPHDGEATDVPQEIVDMAMAVANKIKASME